MKFAVGGMSLPLLEPLRLIGGLDCGRSGGHRGEGTTVSVVKSLRDQSPTPVTHAKLLAFQA